MTASHITPSALTFNGVSIRDRGDMLSLTDMWKAQGADPARQPAEWLRSTDAQRFIAVIVEAHNLGISQVIDIKRGKGGATFAHWQIGLAYAKYLSPEFHMWCNTVVRERMQGRLAPRGHETVAMTEDMRRIIGGIVRAVVHKEVSEMTSQLLPTAVAGYLAEHSLSIADGVTAGEACDLAKVATSYPRGISGRVSKRLTLFCRRNGEKPRVTRLGRVRAQLFPTHLVHDWLDLEGRALIKRWLEESKGQKVLRLAPPL